MKFMKIVLLICVILLTAWIQITVYAVCLLYFASKAGIWPNLD